MRPRTEGPRFLFFGSSPDFIKKVIGSVFKFHLNRSHVPEKPRRGDPFIAKESKKIKLRRSGLFFGMF
jgi:hypothetical protein